MGSAILHMGHSLVPRREPGDEANGNTSTLTLPHTMVQIVVKQIMNLLATVLVLNTLVMKTGSKTKTSACQ